MAEVLREILVWAPKSENRRSYLETAMLLPFVNHQQTDCLQVVFFVVRRPLVGSA